MTDEMTAEEREEYTALAAKLATIKGDEREIRKEMKLITRRAYMRGYRKDK